MTPSIELRIKTMVKALSDVIAPAIDQRNGLANEQVQLVIAHLGLLAQQWDRALSYEMLCAREILRLAQRLCAATAGGSQTTAAGAALRIVLIEHTAIEHGALSLAALNEARAAIATGIDQLIIASAVDGSDAFQQASATAILDHAAQQAWRDRVWFAGAGMDPERDQLPSIAGMLEQAG